MTFRSSLRAGWLVLGLFLLLGASGAEAKPIRLRNQVIPAGFAGQLDPLQYNAQGSTLSGLFLIQFKSPPGEKERAELAAAGVDLLAYVPDNAFVAQLRGSRLEIVRALPSVGWIGKYRPEHKIHSALSALLSAQPSPASIPVTILVAPRSSDGDISQVRGVFASVTQESRLHSGTVLRGMVNAGRMTELAASEHVLWIEQFRNPKLVDEVASKIVAGDGGYQELYSQSLGFDGAGVKVAVADSGLNNGDAASMHPDLFGRTPAFFYYGALTDAADEHSHGTHVAGIIAGNGATGETDGNGALYGLGVAPGASIIAQRIFDGVGNFESPPSFEKLTRDATRAGAVIGSNSWGNDTQGQYDITAMEYDDLVRDADALALGDQPYILEFSAGNAGPGAQTIGSPAVAKNVIATGASENDRLDFIIYSDGPDAMADFSSRGPCEDGRIKPDVVAPGTWISSLQSASASDIYAWSPISENYQYQGGTSQAGPHASGAAAVFVQFYRSTHTNATPSPALVKAALINTATDMDDSYGTGPVPNMDEGWGRVNVMPLFDGSLAFSFLDQTVLLTNSQVYTQHVIVASAAQPLSITLTYTDVPGFPGALAALVNDLDLEVVSPDGRLYRGNQFDSGESIPNPASPDSLNNVEEVRLYTPIPGDYTIRVRASRVVQDAREDTTAIDQDFALVISGQLPIPGIANVLLDHGSYSAPGRIQITLADTALAGRPSTNIVARSTTEIAGETVSLTASGFSGTFTGSIAAATGPPAADGRLQIAHNDTIQVLFFDTTVGSNRIATARADLMPPIISAVTATNELGQTTIFWNTDEPATSIVRYNTNSSLTHAVTNSQLTTFHEVQLPGLTPGRTNYFHVASSDEAGNTATNNNGGLLFNVVGAKPNIVLMVNDNISNGFDNDIPLSVYTNALAQCGLSFDVWDVASRVSMPAANDLRPYRLVIYWFNDGVFSGETLSAADQGAIRSYLDQGGSLFMASMEQLTRLGGGFFRQKVLHVADFNEDAGVPGVTGRQGDAVSAGMNMAFDYSQYGNNVWHDALSVPDDISDTMILTSDASAFLFETDFGEVAGMKYPPTGQDSSGRVVYLPFPLDAVPDAGAAPNNRVTLLRNILSFLVPGVNGRGTVTLDSGSYNIPSTVTVEVGDSNLAGQGTTTVSVASTTQTSPATFSIPETDLPGLFRGTFTLISYTNPPTPGKIRVHSGDLVNVDYFDASSNTTLRATAIVDTTPPTITGVAWDPDYVEATISWSTSEQSDSLVQFGESILLGRTALDTTPTTSHVVVLPGLLPDKSYYFEVSSRDAAGNQVVDDNGSHMYTVHTLKPVTAPWFDDMETGATNWSVYTGDQAQSAWTLGLPNNGQQTNAFSGTNAWGSNLNGDAIDYSETFLISPAIYLVNGNVATLTFWDSYDFTDLTGYDIEMGEIQIITNNAAPIPLADFNDVSSGWQKETVDLTPYVGQVVYLVWYYQLFSTDALPRPGWLVDNVSITVSNVVPGTVHITNNIWQATYVLSGTIYQKAKGVSATITNAPPGQYIMEYADIPYYISPPPQTNSLVPGGSITFQGVYTFPDTNNNGMSDLWEQHFFGNVSSNRTRLTDSDGDGMTDYAEFIAGTDPTSAAPTSIPGTFRIYAENLGNGLVTLTWTSSAGRGYQVQGSANGKTWAPISAWFQGAGPSTSFTFSKASAGAAYLFRVQVLP